MSNIYRAPNDGLTLKERSEENRAERTPCGIMWRLTAFTGRDCKVVSYFMEYEEADKERKRWWAYGFETRLEAPQCFYQSCHPMAVKR